jgi:hypothetical protein
MSGPFTRVERVNDAGRHLTVFHLPQETVEGHALSRLPPTIRIFVGREPRLRVFLTAANPSGTSAAHTSPVCLTAEAALQVAQALIEAAATLAPEFPPDGDVV